MEEILNEIIKKLDKKFEEQDKKFEDFKSSQEKLFADFKSSLNASIADFKCGQDLILQRLDQNAEEIEFLKDRVNSQDKLLADMDDTCENLTNKVATLEALSSESIEKIHMLDDFL